MVKKLKPSDLAVGGQAVIGGVMLRSKDRIACAVRNPQGEIIVRDEPFTPWIKRHKFLNLWVLRGCVNMIEMMVVGTRILFWSSDIALEGEIKSDNKAIIDKQLSSPPRPVVESSLSQRSNVVGEGVVGEGSGHPLTPSTKPAFSTLEISLTVLTSFALSIGMFVIAPYFITNLLSIDEFSQPLLFNAVDGVIKIIFFVVFVWLIGLMPDIREIFANHGAEHSVVNMYEHEDEQSLELARKYSRLHPRCGTSFIFIVLIIGIFIFALIPVLIARYLPALGELPFLWRALILTPVRILFLMPIAGVAYELLKLSGKYRDRWFLQPFFWPGLAIQNLTTRKPNDPQLEVALKALERVI